MLLNKNQKDHFLILIKIYAKLKGFLQAQQESDLWPGGIKAIIQPGYNLNKYNIEDEEVETLYRLVFNNTL